MQRSLGLVAAISLMLTPLWAAAQSTNRSSILHTLVLGK
jgi:hypothetical protein